tara:strand:- start:2980 stop:3996 length:1017 start_codon:yes stop_codon:yes gene_type:complete
VKLTYSDAGVDVAQGDAFVRQISKLVRSTHHSKVKSHPSGYASLYRFFNGYLAASTDGVGTKLKLAFDSGIHTSVGEDLVAMSVNDLLCVGATPAFFLDYLATSRLDPSVHVDVVKGIVRGCKKAKIALVGGETAEMPGFYSSGEYDLAGFAVGYVEREMLFKQKIKKGDVLIGLPSTGFHSNGYSLVRKILEKNPKSIDIRELLKPTEIYVDSVLPLIRSKKIKAMAHITGGGLWNLTRLSQSVSYQVNLPQTKSLPQGFRWLIDLDQVSPIEMMRTFNMGIGMILVVSPENEKSVLSSLRKRKKKLIMLGHVISKKKECEIKVESEWGPLTLRERN